MKSFAIIAACAALGCAGSPPPPNTSEPESSAKEPETKPDEPVAEPEEETDASSEESPDNEKPREVRYIMVGGKLEVETNGVRFRPAVKAVKTGGGWGIKLTVETEVVDGEQHVLLAPEAGIFAFAREITRKGKEPERFWDERKGDGEAVVKPDEKGSFERAWPGTTGDKALAKGDKLKIEVGLWGLGDDKKSRRPVKKFLIVSLNADRANPSAVVLPPE
jgi:hypothetical protein